MASLVTTTINGTLTGNSSATFDGRVQSNNELRVSNDYSVNYFYKTNNNTMLGYLLMRDDNNSFLSFPAAQDFRFLHGNTNRITVKTNGKVGIDTTSPTQKLQVGGTTTEDTAIKIDSAANSNANKSWLINATQADALLRIGSENNPTSLVIKGSDGNVGIGTISPGNHKLKVIGETHSTHFITGYDWTAKTGGLHIGNDGLATGAVSFYNGSNSSANIYRNSDIFYVGARAGVNTRGLAIISNGNVGIGTNVPVTELHLYTDTTGARNAPIDVLTLETEHTSDVEYNGFGQGIVFRGSTYNQNSQRTLGRILHQINDSSVNTTRGTSMSFQTSDNGSNANAPTTKVTIDYKGDVGIGTTTPTGGKLQVAGKVRIDAGSGNDALNLNAYDLLKWDGANLIHFGGYQSSQWQELHFYTNGAKALSIDASQNVGIGTDDPKTKLHIDSGSSIGTIDNAYSLAIRGDGIDGIQILSDSAYSGRIVFGDQNSNNIGRIDYDHSTDAFRFFTNGTEKVSILSGGDVGIGTVSPGYKLDVVGAGGVASARIRSTNANVARLFLANTVGTWRLYSAAASNSFRIFSDSLNDDTFVIESNGNVGINTTSPTSKLQIVGSTSGDSVLRVDGTNGTLFEVVDDLSDSLMSVNDAAGLPVFEVFADNHIVAGRYNQNDFYLDTNGNLGLGTNAPSKKLEVVDSAAAQILAKGWGPDSVGNDGGAIQLGEEAAFHGLFSYDNATSILYIDNAYNSSSGDIRFRTKTSGTAITAVTIEGGGSVGIGTVSPSYKLHVIGDGLITDDLNIGTPHANENQSSTLYLNDSFSGTYDFITLAATQNNASQISRILFKNRYGTGHFSDGQEASYIASERQSSSGIYDLTFGVASANDADATEKMRIDHLGNVGIGTVGPTEKLHVQGNLRLTGAFHDSGNLAGVSGQVLTSTGSGTDWKSISEIGVTGVTSTTPNQLTINQSSPAPALTIVTGAVANGGTALATGNQIYDFVTGLNYITASSTSTLTNKSGNISQWTNNSGYTTNTGTTTASNTQTFTNKSGNISQWTNDSGYTTTTGTVTGTGTVNKLPLWNGTSSLTNSILTQSSTNYVTVFGGVQVSGNHTDIGSQLNLWCDSSGHGELRVYDMEFKTGANGARSNRALFLKTDGNVGIGTDTPVEQLDINGNLNIDTGTGFSRYLFLEFDQTADETWVKVTLPQDSNSTNNGGSVKVRVNWLGKHATFGASQEYLITYTSNHGSSGYPYFSDVHTTSKTFRSASYGAYAPSSTPDVIFYTVGNAEDALYFKVKGYHASYNKKRQVSVEINGRTVTSPVLSHHGNTSPTSPSSISKAIEFNTAGHSYFNGGNVGIGTSAPTSSKLHIIEADTGEGLRVDGASSGFAMIVEGGTSYKTRMRGGVTIGNGYGASTPPDNGLIVEGTVGIGTPAPGSKLHVNGGSKYFGGGDWTTIERVTTTEGNYALYVQTTGTNTNQAIAKFNYGCTAGSANTGTAVAAIAREKSYFLSKLGIGTATPSYKLHTVGGAGVFDITGAATLNHHLAVTEVATLPDWRPYAGTTTAALQIQSSATRGILLAAKSTGNQDFYNTEGLDIYVGSTVGSSSSDKGTLAISAKSDGNVGIGTANPDQKLHVSGLTKLGASGKTEGGAIIGLSSFGETKGVLSTILGNSIVPGTVSSTVQRSTSNIAHFLKINETSGITFHTGLQTTEDADVAESTNEKMRIDIFGKVGIGTSSPTSKLQIVGSTSGDSMLRVDGASGTIFEVTDDLSDSLMSVNTIAGLPVFEVFADNHIVAGRYNQNDFYLNTNGNLGLGTADPGYQLHVSSPTTSAAIGITGSGGSKDTWSITSSDNSSKGVLNFRDEDSSTTVLTLRQDGFVGIGIAGPTSLLHIYSSAPVFTVQDGGTWGTNATAYVDLKDSSSSMAYVGVTGADGHLDIKQLKAGSLRLYTNSTERVSILSDGNVGIGTDDPAHVFTVHKSSGAVNTPIAWLHNSGNFANYDGTVISCVNNGSDAEVLHVRTNNTTYNGGTSLMLVRGDGRVGIGTADPGYPLHVIGKIYSSTEGQFGNTIAKNNSGVATFGSNSTSTTIKINLDASASRNDLVIEGSTGDVGIGTGTPDYQLHVAGTGYFSGNLRLNTEWNSVTLSGNSIYAENSTDGFGFGVGTGISSWWAWSNTGGLNRMIDVDNDGTYIRFRTSNTEKVRINNDGNVGIGTVTPSQKLHVVGKALITDDVQLTGSSPRIDFNTNGSSSLRFYDTTNTAERMRINTSGNLGINTTSPNSKLQIVGSTSGDSVLKVDGTNGTLFEVVDDLSDSLMSVNDAAGLPVFEVFADNTIVGGRYNQNDFYLDGTSGNVGIGTASPSVKLEVKDSQDSSFVSGIGIIRSTGSQTGYINMVGGAFNFNAPSAVPIKFRDGGTTNVTILGDGNVGIGTVGPSYKLHVVGTAHITDNFSVGNGGSGGGATITPGGQTTVYALKVDRSGSSGTSVDIWDNNSDSVVIGATSSEKTLTVKAGGWVGIGTTSPAYGLDNNRTSVRTNSYTAEKVFGVNFPNSTANQKVDISFPYFNGTMFWGYLEVTLTSSYSNQLSTGKLSKVFAVGLNNPGGTSGNYTAQIYDNTNYYTSVYGALSSQWGIEGINFDTTTGQYYITIAHRVSTGNGIRVSVKAYGYSSDHLDSNRFGGLTAGSVYTTDATAFDAAVKEVTNLKAHGSVDITSSIGIGSTLATNRVVTIGNTAGPDRPAIKIITPNFSSSTSSTGKTFYRWMPIDIDGTTRWIAIYS